MNIAFISELGTIIPNLKEKGDVPYGRITKAATQLLLCFYYLKFIDYEVLFIVFVFLCSLLSFAQSPWKITADKIVPDHYYGITVANGMFGLVA
ncbi:MAG: hypothetical protein WCR45_00615 [Bacteroidaceae bacterium]